MKGRAMRKVKNRKNLEAKEQMSSILIKERKAEHEIIKKKHSTFLFRTASGLPGLIDKKRVLQMRASWVLDLDGKMHGVGSREIHTKILKTIINLAKSIRAQ